MSSQGCGAAARATVATLVLLGLGACGSVSPDPTSGAADPPVAPTVSLSAGATSVAANGATTLTWSSTGAQSCTASGGWSGSKATGGSETTGPLTATTAYTLACTGAGGTGQASVTVTVTAPTPPAPTLTLSASPNSVASGAGSTLTWSTTNATSCTASGAWTGARPVSGTEAVGPLTAAATYTLDCAGSGSQSVSRSVTVTIAATTPPPVPTLSFSATPSAVASGAAASLDWSASDATSCTASGGWSGARATSGSASTGALTTTTVYTLACTGAGGTATRSVTVTVNPPASQSVLSGSVDSSLVDSVGDNRVYVYAGDVTPQDDRGDAGDPVVTVPVAQDVNACSYGFELSTLAAGTYTIAYTSQAQADRPNAPDTIAFTGRTVVTVGSSPTRRDFAAARVLQVGPGRTYATIAAAAAAVTPGSVVEVAAGDYPDEVIVWRDDRVVIRGIGGSRPHVRSTALIDYVPGDDRKNGKGLFVIQGDGMRVENLEFSGAKVPDQNGAGIRNEGRNLTICNSFFHDNENGFLGGAYGTLIVEYSTFENNGIGDFGRTHNIYVDDGTTAGDNLIFRYNFSHRAQIGHTLKTRARQNFIAYNRLTDDADGTSSYNIDVPNGGLTWVIGNVIQQGPRTDNSTLVNYGAEGLSAGRSHEFYLVNNTFVNDLGSGAFVDVATGTTTFRAVNNLYVGSGTLYLGKAPAATTNLQSATPAFVDQAGYDYRLTSGSPARDAGSAPGTAAGQSLVPVYGYAQPARRADRPANGPIDVGAYEFQ